MCIIFNYKGSCFIRVTKMFWLEKYENTKMFWFKTYENTGMF
jgi:hypothetical protein